MRTGSDLGFNGRRRRKTKGEKDKLTMNPRCRRTIGGVREIPND